MSKKEGLFYDVRRLISDLAEKVWIEEYVQSIVNEECSSIRTAEPEIARLIIKWADCKEPIFMFTSMCRAAGIDAKPINLDDYSVEFDTAVFTSYGQDYTIEIGYGLKKDKKLTVKKPKEEIVVKSSNNYDISSFSAEYTCLKSRILCMMNLVNTKITIFNEDSENAVLSITVHGIKSQGNFMEVYHKIKNSLESQIQNILVGNVNISNIIGICEKEFNIETIEVFYADKILKYRRYKLLSSYRDYNGIEFYNDENENIIKYRCPLENGIVVEYRKGKYNVFNMDCEDKEKLSYFIKEADKVIDFIMAENRILW